MKHASTWLLVAILCLSAVRSTAQTSSVVQTSNTNENQPYKISLPNLSFGNNQYSKLLLNVWKAYDDNRLDDIAAVISDTVRVGLSNGKMVRGKEDFIKTMKEHRSSFASVVSTVSACTTLKSPNAPQSEFALIWGNELDTKKDGTTQRFALHEVWIFNTEGKVAELYMYSIPIPEN